MTYKSLTYDVRDAVAYLTFSTPDSMNSITEQRLEDLGAAADALEADDTLKAVVISGLGRAFCVGLDLELLKKAFDDVDYFETVVRRLNKFILRLEHLPIPTLAAVNGYARAGGFEIALGCDLLIMADEAKIGDNHTQVGVMPGGGSTQRLPQRVGMQRAMDIIWTAKWLTGPEAVACGLALKSVPRANLETAIEDYLKTIRNKPRDVLSVVKKTMRAGRKITTADDIEIEISNFLDYMRTSKTPHDGFWESIGGRDQN